MPVMPFTLTTKMRMLSQVLFSETSISPDISLGSKASLSCSRDDISIVFVRNMNKPPNLECGIPPALLTGRGGIRDLAEPRAVRRKRDDAARNGQVAGLPAHIGRGSDRDGRERVHERLLVGLKRDRHLGIILVALDGGDIGVALGRYACRPRASGASISES